VGIICRDGIILAADRRATSGYLIAEKRTDKIYNINERIAVTMAGTASDAQLLIKIAQAELRLKLIRTDQEVTVKEAANLMARLVYNNVRKFSIIPGISHFIMAGVDPDKKCCLYDIFADGTISEQRDYVSSGSGSVMAYGVLETLYKEDMSVDEGVKLAVKCINAAVQRDIASGNGIDVFTVTKEGAKRVMQKEFNTRIEA